MFSNSCREIGFHKGRKIRQKMLVLITCGKHVSQDQKARTSQCIVVDVKRNGINQAPNKIDNYMEGTLKIHTENMY